jgi:putative hemolysin
VQVGGLEPGALPGFFSPLVTFAAAANPNGMNLLDRLLDMTSVLPPKPHLEPLRLERRLGAYRVRMARSGDDRLAAYRLRFLVFNLELNEGLASALQTGYDTDAFDPVCDHLIVEHGSVGVVGTYRLQTGEMAGENLGYYSAQEFGFEPFEAIRKRTV